MKKNENAQAVEVKETAPKATKAPKAEETKKPETKAAATAAAPSSPEPPTPTATTKPVEEKPVEQQPVVTIPRVCFRLSSSVQIEETTVWGMGMWAMSDGITSVCLSNYSYDKMMRVIGTSSDYKDIIKALNECMKFERFNSSARHSIERLLIKELGGHTHTHHIRRFFI